VTAFAPTIGAPIIYTGTYKYIQIINKIALLVTFLRLCRACERTSNRGPDCHVDSIQCDIPLVKLLIRSKYESMSLVVALIDIRTQAKSVMFGPELTCVFIACAA